MDGFQKCLCPCALDESNFSIGRVNLLGTAIIDLSIVYFCYNFYYSIDKQINSNQQYVNIGI